MPQSVTKHKANGVKISMEHQKLWIRWRRISADEEWSSTHIEVTKGVDGECHVGVER
jgi:hypothetical protein